MLIVIDFFLLMLNLLVLKRRKNKIIMVIATIVMIKNKKLIVIFAADTPICSDNQITIDFLPFLCENIVFYRDKFINTPLKGSLKYKK